MRIELPREAERFGANLFYGVQKVYEVDAGPEAQVLARDFDSRSVIHRVPYEELNRIDKRMAIVIPIRHERLKLIEGVLFGIPNASFCIIVSNSPREPIDRYSMEKDAIEKFCRFAKKDVVIVHQKDPLLASAFEHAGYSHLLDDETGLVRDGKAEGMIIGTLLARLAGKKYIGFIDADNYFPGSVHEYVREYATGFSLAKSDYSMTRIVWHSKPKVVRSNLYFAKYGRTSVVTNYFLNRLISQYSGFETEVIRTGNAGEHALTMDLAMLLDYAPGYAIEPYHLVNLIEKFGGINLSPYPEVMKQSVEVFQIESRNPHLHESKGEEHVDRMIASSLGAIYHSPSCPKPLKAELLEEMRVRGLVLPNAIPEEIAHYPALINLDLDAFLGEISREAYTATIESHWAAG